ncbi:MAG: penicillin-binding protein [Butyrivibrio sp.]|nr:penicillin-binding protein [Butyrivibrio sp.]
MFEEIKGKFIKFISSRAVMLSGVLIIFACVLVCRLFYLQIVMGDYYRESVTNETQKPKYEPAPRGSIYDRNNNLLAHDERVDSITIEDVYPDKKKSDKNLLINETLQKAIEIIEAHNDSIDIDFEITRDASGKYIDKSDTELDKQKFRRDVYGRTSIKELKPEEKDATPEQIIDFLCYSYSIGEYRDKKDKNSFESMRGYSDDMGFKILVIRYNMAKKGFQNYLPTTIASNVEPETAAAILENSDELKGVSVASNYIRMYDDDFVCFSPILGYTGKISTAELDKLNGKTEDDSDKSKFSLLSGTDSDDTENNRYDMNDIVGKAGIEKSMESELQGIKGKEMIHVDNTGHVLGVSDVVEPIKGHDVYLTIDKELTKSCYKILEKNLTTILLDKLRNERYDPVFDEKPSANQMWIPIYDAYINLFENGIIDINNFSKETAQPNEQAVYAAFLQKKKDTVATIKDELLNKKTPKKQLSKEYQEYMDYIVSALSDETYPIITADKEDETYKKIKEKAWKQGDISLADFIDKAIINQWIDASKLDLEDLYADSDETYNEIVNFIVDGKKGKGSTRQYGLNNDRVFDASLYKYMLYSDEITPKQVCNVLLEQGVIKEDNIEPEELARWKSGAETPYEFIRNRLEKLDITPAQLGLYPCTGSMVITDVKTGDILALVSYPGYDNNRISNGADADYLTKLLTDKSNAKPMFNHATMEKTAPGSTFKMVTATAGLMENVITTTQTISCGGSFSKMDPAHPAKCWKSGGHGSLNVVGGIRNSCNVFFYEVGFRLGTTGNKYDPIVGCEKLKKYAGEYGLTEKSGIEIEELMPEVAKEDAVRGAIGQDKNNYTTVGLARYITTVANGGTCYDLTLVDKIALDQYGNVKDNSAKIRNKIQMPKAYFDFIHLGMRQVVMDKPYYSELSNKGCPVAGKTGTAEEGWKPNHSLFVCYAPYSDTGALPEIAVATRVANGYTSSYAAQITEKVLEYYFKYKTLDEILDGGEHLVSGGRED